MDRSLIKEFWNCGDCQIIEYAIMKARLNSREKTAVTMVLDECMTQEEAAEKLNISPRYFQSWWYSATNKLLSIPWVYAYAKELRNNG